MNNRGKHLSLNQATETHGSELFPNKQTNKAKALKLLCVNKVEMLLLILVSCGLFLLSRGWLLVGLGPVLMSLTALTWKCYLWSHNRF